MLVSRCATRAAESKWRLMGANNLAEAKQTFKARIRRSIGVEGARGLARLRLANLVEVHTFNRGPSACVLRQREKAFYYDAREAHYTTSVLGPAHGSTPICGVAPLIISKFINNILVHRESKYQKHPQSHLNLYIIYTILI